MHDRINGQAGTEKLKSGKGNDSLRDLRGNNEVINCGPGRDMAVTNRRSKDADRPKCEKVKIVNVKKKYRPAGPRQWASEYADAVTRTADEVGASRTVGDGSGASAHKRADSPWTKPHFLALESLRGLAVLAVVAAHARGSVLQEAAINPWLDEIALLGVPVFFVLSGFVLWRPHAERRLQGAPPLSPARFARRRAARILPAYLLVLCGALVLAPNSVPIEDHPVRYLTFAQSFNVEWYEATVTTGIGPTWSLCIEVWFYVSLALVLGSLLLLKRPQPRFELIALALVSIGAWLAFLTSVQALSGSIVTLWLPALSQFVAGMALAVIHVHRRTAVERFGLRRGPIAATLVAMLLLGGFLGNYQPAIGTLVGVGLVLVAIGVDARTPLALTGKRWLQHVAHHPLALWIGTISFSIYLWHNLFLFKLRGGDTVAGFYEGVAGTVAALALTLAIAAGSWYLLERPVLRRVR